MPKKEDVQLVAYIGSVAIGVVVLVVATIVAISTLDFHDDTNAVTFRTPEEFKGIATALNISDLTPRRIPTNHVRVRNNDGLFEPWVKEPFQQWMEPKWLVAKGLTVLELALFAEVAYSFHNIRYVPQGRKKVSAGGHSTILPAFSELKVHKTPFRLQSTYSIDNTEFAALYDEERSHLVIAFRGTADSGDAVDDAMFSLLPWKTVLGENETEVLVHEGFAKQYASAREALMETLEAHIDVGCEKVSITGHSLGAALTTLAAVDIARNFPQLDIDATTFGSPKVGNQAFADMYRATIAGNQTIRVANLDPDCLNKPQATLIGPDMCQDKVSIAPFSSGPLPYVHVCNVTLTPMFSGATVHAGPDFELRMHGLASYEQAVYEAAGKKQEDP